MQCIRAMLFLGLSLCIGSDLCARMQKGSNLMMTDMSIEGEVERIIKEFESYGPGIDHAAVSDKLKRLYQIIPEVAEASRRSQFIDRLQRLGFNFVGDAFSASAASTDDHNEQIITLLGNATALLDTLEDVIRADNYDQSYADQLVTELYGILPQIPVSQDRDRLLVRAEKTGLPLPEIYLERFSDMASVPQPPEQEEVLSSAERQEELQKQNLQHVRQTELYKRRAELAEREAKLTTEKLELCQQLLKQEEQKNALWKESREGKSKRGFEEEEADFAEDKEYPDEPEVIEIQEEPHDDLSKDTQSTDGLSDVEANEMDVDAVEEEPEEVDDLPEEE